MGQFCTRLSEVLGNPYSCAFLPRRTPFRRSASEAIMTRLLVETTHLKYGPGKSQGIKATALLLYGTLGLFMYVNKVPGCLEVSECNVEPRRHRHRHRHRLLHLMTCSGTIEPPIYSVLFIVRLMVILIVMSHMESLSTIMTDY